MEPKPPQLESFHTRLPAELVRRIRVHAALENKQIQDVVAAVLDAGIPKIKESKAKP